MELWHIITALAIAAAGYFAGRMNGVQVMRYNYHVAYYFVDQIGATGFGSMNIRRSRGIENEGDITNVSEFIKGQHQLRAVTILNFIDLD